MVRDCDLSTRADLQTWWHPMVRTSCESLQLPKCITSVHGLHAGRQQRGAKEELLVPSDRREDDAPLAQLVAQTNSAAEAADRDAELLLDSRPENNPTERLRRYLGQHVKRHERSR